MDTNKPAAAPAALRFGRPSADVTGDSHVQEPNQLLPEGDPEAVVLDEGDDSVAVVPLAVYSSHPVSRLRIGDFEFVGGRLELFSERDVQAMDKLHASLPPAEKRRFQKLDQAAAEAMVQAIIGSRVITGLDSTANTLTPPNEGGDKA